MNGLTYNGGSMRPDATFLLQTCEMPPTVNVPFIATMTTQMIMDIIWITSVHTTAFIPP